ncbi:hypothetical protein HU200_060339 [Digitaria exilis]|uniref:Uncharacterized protein n=1 Tax=Digitaria exilis TaxID=1010633 RepID=A0A835AGL1_9POAL|nr:hypothetical protein HU200_060339 [Digitaria exilis]
MTVVGSFNKAGRGQDETQPDKEDGLLTNPQGNYRLLPRGSHPRPRARRRRGTLRFKFKLHMPPELQRARAVSSPCPINSNRTSIRSNQRSTPQSRARTGAGHIRSQQDAPESCVLVGPRLDIGAIRTALPPGWRLGASTMVLCASQRLIAGRRLHRLLHYQAADPMAGSMSCGILMADEAQPTLRANDVQYHGNNNNPRSLLPRSYGASALLVAAASPPPSQPVDHAAPTSTDTTASPSPAGCDYPRLASSSPPLLPLPSNLLPIFTPIGATVPLPRWPSSSGRPASRRASKVDVAPGAAPGAHPPTITVKHRPEISRYDLRRLRPPEFLLAQGSRQQFWVISASPHIPLAVHQVRKTLNFCFSTPPNSFTVSNAGHGIFSSTAANANLAKYIISRSWCRLGNINLLLFPDCAAATAAVVRNEETTKCDVRARSGDGQLLLLLLLGRLMGLPPWKALVTPSVRNSSAPHHAMNDEESWEKKTLLPSGVANGASPPPRAARPYLEALLSTPASPHSRSLSPIKMAAGLKLRRAHSLPPPQTQCFKWLVPDHLVAACRDPVRCRQCLHYGHRSFSCSMVGSSLQHGRLWSSRYSAQRAQRRSLSHLATPSPAGARASWLSPAVDQRLEGDSTPPPHRHCPHSPPDVVPNHGAVGALLFPPVPLWSLVTGATSAPTQDQSSDGLPRVEIHDLPKPVRARSPSPPSVGQGVDNELDTAVDTLPDMLSAPLAARSAGDGGGGTRGQHPPSSCTAQAPSGQCVQATPQPATSGEGGAILHRRDYQGHMSQGCQARPLQGMLRRPPPAKISTSKLRSLGRVCGIGHLSEVDDEELCVTSSLFAAH